MDKLFLAVFASVLFFAVVACVNAATSGNGIKVVFISDLHLDIDYATADAGRGGCTKPVAGHELDTYGCDSPQALVESAIKNAAQQDKDAQLVLCSGDLLRHDADELPHAKQVETAKTVVDLMGKYWGPSQTTAVPSFKLFDVLGNNGAVPDYFFNISANYKPVLTDIAAELEAQKFLSSTEASQFKQCGYMKKTVTGLTSGNKKIDVDVIAFNSLLWDQELEPVLVKGTAEYNDPCGQMAFMEKALNESAAAKRPVITITHIPPSIDLHESTDEITKQGLAIDNVTYYWHDRFSSKFYSLINAHKATVRLQVYAHTHHVGFVADRKLGVPALIVGAVSPVYFNRPMYLTMEFSADEFRPDWSTLRQVGVSNFSTGATWSAMTPSFASLFQLPAPPAATATTTSNGDAAAVTQQATTFDVYERDHFAPFYNQMCRDDKRTLDWYNYSAAYGKAEKKCDAKCRLLTFCYATELTRQGVVACYKKGCPSTSSSSDDKLALRVSLGVVFSLLAIIVLFVLFRVRNSRKRSDNGEIRNVNGGTSAAGAVMSGSDMEHQKLEPGATRDAGYV